MDLFAVCDGSLPKHEPLPGCVVAQYRTAKGKRYGPYWFRTWRDEDGRQRKTYVPKANLAEVRAACRAHLLQRRWQSRSHLKRLVREERRKARSIDLTFILDGGKPLARHIDRAA